MVITMNKTHAHLVDLRQILPEAFFDIRYATSNNFTGQSVYSQPFCYLEEKPAHALRKLQDKLNELGLRLKIFDAYRPLAVQKIFWDLVPDPRYVADPAKGSKHNRGCAVDLTLSDINGRELPMGTDFDDFSEVAHTAHTATLSVEERHNRLLLQNLMEEVDFRVEPTEWWHFNYNEWQNFPIFNIPFEQLDRKE